MFLASRKLAPSLVAKPPALASSSSGPMRWRTSARYSFSSPRSARSSGALAVTADSFSLAVRLLGSRAIRSTSRPPDA